ncbi:inositol monophosphatase family protein [Mariniblastus fucicola]|uniref:Inositol-1-monophosphatase n=1 Tax=Mariniblastus fucicola TaxID=980251 RepID=A0A5B9P2X9_9BACT|nr:inositol monophosphatase family protein [Mariniblastus fucicola]QEG20887.1 Inositol-1-monophosphatase [Mariniblastus fucicola]
MTSSFQTQLAVALSAANNAGQILKDYFEQGVASEVKLEGGKKQGLVTVADVEAEAAIMEVIRGSFPDHAFLAEESAATGDNPDHLWVIDPLDGTNNFAFGIPHFAVSIAYIENGKPAVGVVLDPVRDEQFVAVRDGGASLNGKPIHVCESTGIDSAIVGTGFYYDRGEMMSQTLRCIETLFRHDIQGLRRMGAASLDLAYVACGRFGAFFELTLSPWDFAAAQLMVTEAGGQITNCSGREIGLEATDVLATNGRLHAEMMQLLAKGANEKP